MYGSFPSSYPTLSSSRDASLGAGNFGKARVTCCFKATQTKWGLLDSQSPGDKNKAGLMYFEIAFQQPPGFQLLDASVRMEFSTPELPSCGPFVHHHAPRAMCGQANSRKIQKSAVFEPGLDLSALGGLGMTVGSKGKNSEYVEEHRWQFTSTREPDDQMPNEYTKVVWKWADEQDRDMKPFNRPFDTAVVLYVGDDTKPFQVQLFIQGKLRSHRSRLREFSFNNRRGVQPSGPFKIMPKFQAPAPDLKALVEGLDAELADKNNSRAVPVYADFLNRPGNNEPPLSGMSAQTSTPTGIQPATVSIVPGGSSSASNVPGSAQPMANPMPTYIQQTVGNGSASTSGLTGATTMTI